MATSNGGPAVAALRTHFQIDWAVRAPYRELVEIVASVRAIEPSVRTLRNHDVVIDFQGLMKSAILARISGAPERYGFARDFIREKPAAWFMNHHVTIDSKTHVVEWNLQLARAVLPGVTMPSIDFSAFAAPEPSGFRERMVIIPAAGRPEKEWPEALWIALGRALSARGRLLLLPWGNEAEHARSVRIAAAVANARVPERQPLDRLAGLIGGASFVIGVDTGLIHLAAALGVPLVAIFAGSEPGRTGPIGHGPIAVVGSKQRQASVPDVLGALETLA